MWSNEAVSSVYLKENYFLFCQNSTSTQLSQNERTTYVSPCWSPLDSWSSVNLASVITTRSFTSLSTFVAIRSRADTATVSGITGPCWILGCWGNGWTLLWMITAWVFVEDANWMFWHLGCTVIVGGAGCVCRTPTAGCVCCMPLTGCGGCKQLVYCTDCNDCTVMRDCTGRTCWIGCNPTAECNGRKHTEGSDAKGKHWRLLITLEVTNLFRLLSFTHCAEQDGTSLRLTWPIFRFDSIFHNSFSVSESDLPVTESARLGTGELDGEHSDEYRLPEDGDERLAIDSVGLYSRELDKGMGQTASVHGSFCSRWIFDELK